MLRIRAYDGGSRGLTLKCKWMLSSLHSFAPLMGHHGVNSHLNFRPIRGYGSHHFGTQDAAYREA